MILFNTDLKQSEEVLEQLYILLIDSLLDMEDSANGETNDNRLSKS